MYTFQNFFFGFQKKTKQIQIWGLELLVMKDFFFLWVGGGCNTTNRAHCLVEIEEGAKLSEIPAAFF